MKPRSVVERHPLSDEELRCLTPEQMLRLRLSEEEKLRLRSINAQRKVQRERRARLWKQEQKHLLADLAQVGIEVQTVWDLLSASSPYPGAIPVLLHHLQLPYSDRTKDGIARALARDYPEVRSAWPVLVDAYRRAPSGQGVIAPGDPEEFRLGAKDGLACALAVVATDDELEELIELIRDPGLGDSRILLLRALRVRRRKNRWIQEIVAELAIDPVFRKEIAAW